MIEQARLFAEEEHKGVRLYVEHDTSVDEWLKENHYLHSTPAGAILRLCFKDEAGRVIGCMMWGRPTSRKIDQTAILELTRMCFVDDTPPFVESKCLGMARKHIRKHYGQIKGLIAYSSTGAGHERRRPCRGITPLPFPFQRRAWNNNAFFAGRHIKAGGFQNWPCSTTSRTAVAGRRPRRDASAPRV